MNVPVEDQVRQVATRLFAEQGMRNVAFDRSRGMYKLRRIGKAEGLWSTEEVGDWFLDQAKGVAPESATTLKPGWAVASEISLARIPFWGDTAHVVGRIPDTFGETEEHPRPAFYTVYNLNVVQPGDMVGRMTRALDLWLFVRTEDGWMPFVFVLKRKTKKRKAKKPQLTAAPKQVPSSSRSSAVSQSDRPVFSDSDR